MGELRPVTKGDLVLALAVLSTLVTLGLLAGLLRDSRPAAQPRVDRRRRAPHARRDPREAVSLLGNALAATHDPRALLPVILEVTVEATGAEGGRLISDGREVAWVGSNGHDVPLRLGLPVAGQEGDAVLLLHPPEGGFTPETVELASWLVSQAAIALENAALHHVVQRQATTDELTGLANRRRFMEALAAEVERVDRHGGGFALLLLDLDDFKAINDRFGHHVGDAALRRFAELLTSELREVDVGGRIGGEEFAVLLPEADLEGAVAAAGRIRRSVAETYLFPSEGVRVRYTVSIGVAPYSHGSADELLQTADAALYRAKAEGKNRVAVSDAV